VIKCSTREMLRLQIVLVVDNDDDDGDCLRLRAIYDGLHIAV